MTGVGHHGEIPRSRARWRERVAERSRSDAENRACGVKMWAKLAGGREILDSPTDLRGEAGGGIEEMGDKRRKPSGSAPAAGGEGDLASTSASFTGLRARLDSKSSASQLGAVAVLLLIPASGCSTDASASAPKTSGG